MPRSYRRRCQRHSSRTPRRRARPRLATAGERLERGVRERRTRSGRNEESRILAGVQSGPNERYVLSAAGAWCLEGRGETSLPGLVSNASPVHSPPPLPSPPPPGLASIARSPPLHSTTKPSLLTVCWLLSFSRAPSLSLASLESALHHRRLASSSVVVAPCPASSTFAPVGPALSPPLVRPFKRPLVILTVSRTGSARAASPRSHRLTEIRLPSRLQPATAPPSPLTWSATRPLCPPARTAHRQRSP